MEEYVLEDNYKYLYFSDDKEMYSFLDEHLKKGYKINDSFNLSLELAKNEKKVLISLLKEFPDENLKDKLKKINLRKEVLYPDYDDTLLGIISGMKANFGSAPEYKIIDGIFDKKYKKINILILDGLGENILFNNLDENSFLRRHYEKSIHALYPSTTACATTSIKCGKEPLIHGWTGWENYISELGKNIVLFNGTDYYSGEPTGTNYYKFNNFKMFYEDMSVSGYVCEPDFSKEKHHIKEVLKASLKINKRDEKQVQYVYYTEPDYSMHADGAYALSVKRILKDIDKRVEAYAKKLTPDTLLIISADHGHTNVDKLDFYACKPIIDLLERNPSNDGRCITFKVKNDKRKEFEEMFNALYGSVYELYKAEDAINKGFFGNSKIRHERLNDFLADYVAVAVGGYYFNYCGPNNFEFKSHHAGITKDEMLVPLIVVRK